MGRTLSIHNDNFLCKSHKQMLDDSSKGPSHHILPFKFLMTVYLKYQNCGTILFTKDPLFCSNDIFIVLLSRSKLSVNIYRPGLCGKLCIPKITTITPFPHAFLQSDLTTSHKEVQFNNLPLKCGLTPVTCLIHRM